MKKKNVIILSLLIILLILFIFFRINEDNWICENGQWIKHGNPTANMPTTACEIKTTGNNTNTEYDGSLILNNFNENDLLQTGFVIEGKIKDNFFFEGTFPIEVQDMSGNTLGISFATSKTDWMTSDYIEFKTEPINFDKKSNTEGYILFKKDNPSGLSEKDRTIKLKVKF